MTGKFYGPAFNKGRKFIVFGTPDNMLILQDCLAVRRREGKKHDALMWLYFRVLLSGGSGPILKIGS